MHNTLYEKLLQQSTQLSHEGKAWLAKSEIYKVSASTQKRELTLYLRNDVFPNLAEYKELVEAITKHFQPLTILLLPVVASAEVDKALPIVLFLLQTKELLPAGELVEASVESESIRLKTGSVFVARGLEKRQIPRMVTNLLQHMGCHALPTHVVYEETLAPKAKPVEGLCSEPKKNPLQKSARKETRSASSKEHVIFGKAIHGEARVIKEIQEEDKNVILFGEVFTVEEKALKSGRYVVNFSLTDYEDSMPCTLFCEKTEVDDLIKALQPGCAVRVRGPVREDSYRHELTLTAYDINAAERFCRVDLAEEKRVELHLHTQMSDMDAVSRLDDLIKTAAEYGHEAMAITDHGVVQAFPEAYQLGKKLGVKILYGLEAYIFDDAIPENQKPRTYHCILLAKNMQGLENIYKLVTESHLRYFKRRPRIPKRLIEYAREGLIVGSACEAGELIQHIIHHPDDDEGLWKLGAFYDYIEVQPIANNAFMIDKGWVKDAEGLRDINRKLDALAKDLDKPLVATCDVHFAKENDGIFRSILMASRGFQDAENQTPLYYRTTTEMLEEFAYLGEARAYEAVVANPKKIADSIEELKPVPDELYAPEIDGAEEQIISLTMEKAHALYGNSLPDVVEKRIKKELDSIINNGFAVLYLIAHKLVKKSNEDGYLVGSRGSVGSSVVAYLTDITEVNALPPHYRCPSCRHSEFMESGRYGTGVDMPDAVCPHCGTPLVKDGFDIPFEVFLGFKGDKVPDIDLNFSGEYQPQAHQFTETLFGIDNVFRAGTISTIKEKTALGYVLHFADDIGTRYRSCEIERLKRGCTGVKRTTGQHPGGLMVVPKGLDVHHFTPLQRPANDTSTEIVTTHFDYHSISERLVKLDILGHDDPTVINMLEAITGIDARNVPLDDAETLSLFSSTDALEVSPERLNSNVATYGIPEFNTRFTRKMLEDTMPASFSDLLRISGYSHGTDVWLNNAKDLIKNKVAPVSETISTRDDIMLYLINRGMEASSAFSIMEKVRKGRGISEEHEGWMKVVDTPAWYITSCKKIKYLFPKAHAVAYVMMAYRIAWFKINHPLAFYASYFSVRGVQDFDLMTIVQGEDAVRAEIHRLYGDDEKGGKKTTDKEAKKITVLEVALELYCRGFRVLSVDLEKSDAKRFIILDESILPPLIAIPGLGQNMADTIVAAREEAMFTSIQDMKTRARVSDSIIEAMRTLGVVEHLPNEDQMALF